MDITAWAKEHLISKVPADAHAWHWTRMSPAILVERLRTGRELTDFSDGATGRGFYLSTSAIDLIDKGDRVLHAIVPAGTPVLMVDADLFGIGVREIMEIQLAERGWAFPFPATKDHVLAGKARPAQQGVPHLLGALDLPACVYVFGFHLAFMVRDPKCLRLDPDEDAIRTVAEYVATHPKERPTLAPREMVDRWLAAQGELPKRRRS